METTIMGLYRGLCTGKGLGFRAKGFWLGLGMFRGSGFRLLFF